MRPLLILVAILAALYGGYWLVGERQIEARAAQALDDLRAEGWQVDYASLDTSGFPSRFDTTLTDLRIADPSGQVTWSAPFVQALTFDRKTGAQVAWDSLLPSDLVEPPDAPLVDPGQITGTLRLTDVYVAAHGALDDECRTEISGRAHDFHIWMVAGGVVLQPSDLAHAVLACADPVTLSGPHLDGLGLDGEVLAALRASLP